MFNSAIEILSNYLEKVTSFNLYSIEMERGKDGEDLYYLCNVDGDFYVVFETDYVDPTPYQAKEAAAIFEDDDLKAVGWLAKKGIVGGDTLPLDTSLVAASDALILERPKSYLRHAVLKLESTKEKQKRHHPDAYGGAV